MSEMIDRVGRAIAVRRAEIMLGDDGIIRTADERELARAAFAAMREPTRKMLSAGGFYHIHGAGSVSDSDMAIAKREWQAMIDAALGDAK